MCDKTAWTLNTTHAYLRSHSDFPWNYGDQPRVCRKRICVHRKFGLRLVSDPLDLSPNPGGDRLKVWRVSRDNQRRLLGVFTDGDRLEECFTSGCVDLEFLRRPHRARGKGFLLRLDSQCWEGGGVGGGEGGRGGAVWGW